MARPAKITCDCCGNKHDLRKASIGLCARCEQNELETTQNWSSETFLATIENVGVRGSYGTYLNKIARLLGAASRRDIDWSAVTESVVVQVAKELGKKLGSSVTSAFRGLREWFLANVSQPVTGCYFIPPTDVEDVTPGLVRINGSLYFKATLKNNKFTQFDIQPKTLNAFELEFLV